MTCKCKKARKAAELAAEEVLEHGSSALNDVLNYVAPRAKQAGEQAKAAGQHAIEIVVPVIEDARGRVVPAFEDARHRVTPLVTEMVDKVSPTVHHAYDVVSDRVQQDVYPKLQELWEQANENPTVVEASRRGRSAVAALRGDLALPEPVLALPEPTRRRGVVGTILTVLGIAALLGAIAVAVRAVLGSDDDGWSPAEPMRPGDAEATWGANPFAEPDVDTAATTSVDEAEQVMEAEGGPADEPAEEPAARAEQEYGEGAYIGTEPPEGFAIKGNERSMKYHVPEAAGYDRTNADVWFNSEEAAQAAGFTRASR